jgi:hypothetical protein
VTKRDLVSESSDTFVNKKGKKVRRTIKRIRVVTRSISSGQSSKDSNYNEKPVQLNRVNKK